MKLVTTYLIPNCSPFHYSYNSWECNCPTNDLFISNIWIGTGSVGKICSEMTFEHCYTFWHFEQLATLLAIWNFVGERSNKILDFTERIVYAYWFCIQWDSSVPNAAKQLFTLTQLTFRIEPVFLHFSHSWFDLSNK